MKPVGEVEFVNGIAAMSASGKYGKTRLCAGIIGHADLMLGDRAKPVLEALIQAGNGRFRGIRHGAMWDTGNAAKFGRRHVPRHQLLDPQFRKGFACLQPLGLSFEAWVFHPQLPDVAGLLKQFPDTNVILNHVGGLLGIPPHENRKETFKVWHKNILQLVQYPNMSVKLGGLGMLYCGWDFHFRDVPPSSEELATEWRPYIETCIEAFGVERCMMESNFPVDKQSTGYGVLWNALKRIAAGASADEKTALFSGVMVSVGLAPVPVGNGRAVDDVEIVDLVSAAPSVKHRGRRVVPHAGRAVLVGAVACHALGIDLLHALRAGRFEDVRAAIDEKPALAQIVLVADIVIRATGKPQASLTSSSSSTRLSCRGMSCSTIATAIEWLKLSRSFCLAAAPHAGASGRRQLIGRGMPTPAQAMWPPLTKPREALCS